ncbi:MAG TPA: hypothetical protein VFZ98_04535, partial [Vicinamibacterales bacterium]
MRKDLISVRITRRVGSAIFVAALAVAFAAPAAGQGYRARMSRDIADRIAHRVEAPAEIIVSTVSGNTNALVARYGVVVR